MNRRFIQFLYGIIALILIAACGAVEEPVTETEQEVQEQVVEETIRITISENEGETILSEKEVEINDGDILLDVLKESFDIEEEGGFITAIDGVEADESKQEAWMYFVNDEMAMVGAAEYELESGDHVVFDLQEWE